jgi:hypothetical protein
MNRKGEDRLERVFVINAKSLPFLANDRSHATATTTSADLLRKFVVAIKTDKRFTEAVIELSDKSLLCFRHAVGERWIKAIGPNEKPGGFAQNLMGAISMFRLNAKHLEISFNDGSSWEWIPYEK